MPNVIIVGKWRIDFNAGSIRKTGLLRRKSPLDARLLAVLEILCRNAGRTVATEQILADAWPGRVVSRDSVTTAIYQLRALLGDNADRPEYIRSESRRGYRLIAPVRPPRAIRRPTVAEFATAAMTASIALLVFAYAPQQERYLVVEPLEDLSQLTEMQPLFQAIDTTLFSELVAQTPAYVLSGDGTRDNAFRMQSRLVACDLGPALVVRLEDTANDVYFWAKAYTLDETYADPEGPSLVTQVASEVSEALHAYTKE